MLGKPRWQRPRLDPDEALLGGVGHALATEIGVPALVVRICFVLLAIGGGWGLFVYAAGWLYLRVAPVEAEPYVPDPKGPSETARYLAIGMVTTGLLMLARTIPSQLFSDAIVFSAGLFAIGVLIAWSRGSLSRTESMITRLAVASVFAVVALGLFLALAFSTLAAAVVSGIALAVLGVFGVLLGPTIVRLASDLGQERLNRARADERAVMAAHLHDSVLQTLALVQRHSDNPARTAQLARRQERELRQWLYASAPSTSARSTPSSPQSLRQLLEQLADKVEERHEIPVEVVVVGDSNLPFAVAQPLLGACREALTNAAKHSGAKQIDVFAEAHTDRVEVFVRDTGCGFLPDEVAHDRHGIVDSIAGRMERISGTATIHSTLGEGTEVELSAPLPSSETSENKDNHQ